MQAAITLTRDKANSKAQLYPKKDFFIMYSAHPPPFNLFVPSNRFPIVNVYQRLSTFIAFDDVGVNRNIKRLSKYIYSFQKISHGTNIEGALFLLKVKTCLAASLGLIPPSQMTNMRCRKNPHSVTIILRKIVCMSVAAPICQ